MVPRMLLNKTVGPAALFSPKVPCGAAKTFVRYSSGWWVKNQVGQQLWWEQVVYPAPPPLYTPPHQCVYTAED